MTDFKQQIIEKWYPVERLELLRTDALIHRKKRDIPEDHRGIDRGQRKNISAFSTGSWTRLMFLVRNTFMFPFSLITLTYPKDFPLDGRLSKSHLECFRKSLRYKFRYSSDLWFLEFQKRGAPHYHIMSTIDLSHFGLQTGRRRRIINGKVVYREYLTNFELQDWVLEIWNRIVFTSSKWSSDSDRSKHRKVSSSWEHLVLRDAAARYVAKHFAKSKQKQVPKNFQNVGRFWGRSNAVKEAVLPISIVETDSKKLDEQLRELDWFGLDYYEELGYFPNMLFGVGELAFANPDIFHFPDGIHLDDWLEQFLADEDEGMEW